MLSEIDVWKIENRYTESEVMEKSMKNRGEGMAEK